MDAVLAESATLDPTSGALSDEEMADGVTSQAVEQKLRKKEKKDKKDKKEKRKSKSGDEVAAIEPEAMEIDEPVKAKKDKKKDKKEKKEKRKSRD